MRLVIEDAYSMHVSLNGDRHYAFFGVYDGHGDDGLISAFLAQHLYNAIIQQPQFG